MLPAPRVPVAAGAGGVGGYLLRLAIASLAAAPAELPIPNAPCPGAWESFELYLWQHHLLLPALLLALGFGLGLSAGLLLGLLCTGAGRCFAAGSVLRASPQRYGASRVAGYRTP